jgi:hypothetical protein
VNYDPIPHQNNRPTSDIVTFTPVHGDAPPVHGDRYLRQGCQDQVELVSCGNAAG